MDLKAVKLILPHGAIKEISSKSGVQYCQVSRIFNGLTTKDTLKVMEVTAEYLKEYQDRESKATQKINDLLTEVPEPVV